MRWLIVAPGTPNAVQFPDTVGGSIYCVLQMSPDGITWTNVPTTAGP